MKEAFNQLRDRLEQINTMDIDKEIKAEVKSQRERFVVLKEASGNFAIAFVILAVSCLINKPTCLKPLGGFILLLLVAALILEVSHYLHGARQASFEIRALSRFGLSQENAKKMFAMIPNWTGERPEDNETASGGGKKAGRT